MRGNNTQRYVNRDGQLLQMAMENGGNGVPVPPEPVPPGQADADGGMNAPRMATFVIMAFVCILLLVLAAGVIRKVGQWAFSGDRDVAIVAVEESFPAEISEPVDNVKAEYFQKPILPRVAYRVAAQYKSAADEAHEVSQTEAVPYEPVQLADEKPLYQEKSRQRKTSVLVSHEPVVDYRASVREMETALETRRSEIQRITAELRDIGRSDENDW